MAVVVCLFAHGILALSASLGAFLGNTGELDSAGIELWKHQGKNGSLNEAIQGAFDRFIRRQLLSFGPHALEL